MAETKRRVIPATKFKFFTVSDYYSKQLEHITFTYWSVWKTLSYFCSPPNLDVSRDEIEGDIEIPSITIKVFPKRLVIKS